MSRKSYCWDAVASEIVELDSIDSLISSDEDVPVRTTVRTKKKSLNSGRIRSKNPNPFRIESDDGSSSDDCIIYSDEENQPPSTPNKTKLLSLPKFSYETPDKSTSLTNQKLLLHVSNQCTPKRDLSSLLSESTFGSLSNCFELPKVNKTKKPAAISSQQKASQNDKIFDQLVGKSRKSNEKESTGYSNILQSFNSLVSERVSPNKEEKKPKKSQKNSSLKLDDSDTFFKKPATFKKQKEIGNKIKRPADSKIVSRRTDDSDSADCASLDEPIYSADENDGRRAALSVSQIPTLLEPENEPIELLDDDICVKASPRPPIRRKGKTSAFVFTDINSVLTDIGKNNPNPSERKLTFLESLNEAAVPTARHPTAAFYADKFAKKKEELTAVLYKMFNDDVFSSKLPDDMKLDWSGRMTSSAGITHLSRKMVGGQWNFLARITLSKPIVTTPARLRDTLIHEMCHAAVWLLDHKKDGHGSYWKDWTHKAREAFPELTPISTCHTYSRDWKYLWECVSCGYTIGRMTKSFNTERFTCGRCHGRFQLKENSKKKREANGFAKFVKENYASVKSENENSAHKDVMKLLSQKYQTEKNKIESVPNPNESDEDLVVLSDEE